jgi:hypothetical protein
VERIPCRASQFETTAAHIRPYSFQPRSLDFSGDPLKLPGMPKSPPSCVVRTALTTCLGYRQSSPRETGNSTFVASRMSRLQVTSFDTRRRRRHFHGLGTPLFSARHCVRFGCAWLKWCKAERRCFEYAGNAGRSRIPRQGSVWVASSTRIRHAEMERPAIGVATPLIFAVTNVLFRGFRPVPAVERYAAEYAVIFGQSAVATRCT